MKDEIVFDDDYSRSSDPVPVVLALVVGAALGAAAALLLTPKSGQDVREAFLTRASNWRNLAADSIISGRERLIDSVEKKSRE